MSKGYRPYLPDQDLLLPPSLQEWLPEGHLVYFVSDVVNQLDLSAVHAVYGEEKRGQPPYDPRLTRFPQTDVVVRPFWDPRRCSHCS